MKDWVISTLLAGLAVFAPIQGVIITVGILIFGDMFTGVWAAYKRKEPITSAALRRSVTKMAVFQFAVLSGYLLEVYLLGGLLPVAKLVAGVVGLVEFKSVLENAKEITGLDFSSVIKKLGSKNDEL